MVLVLFLGLAAAAAGAQTDVPWCSADPLHPQATPYPAPTWSQLDAVPDYHQVMDNFELAQSLRLLISALEKALLQLGDGQSLASVPDVEGICLCRCGKDAAYFKRELAKAFQDGIPLALRETRDNYVKGLEDALLDLKASVQGALPAFAADVEAQVKKTCDQLPACEDPNAIVQFTKDKAQEIIDRELDLLVGPDSPFMKEVGELEAELDELLQAALDHVGSLKNFSLAGAVD